MRTNAKRGALELSLAILILFAGALVVATRREPAQPAGVDLAAERSAAGRRIELPATLREVSGVTSVDSHTLACVQDEDGVLYLVDVERGAVVGARPFGPPGDYEGLARVGDDFYALRSEGALLRLVPAGERLRVAAQHALSLPEKELEGLCHDPTRGLLLVAPKTAPKDAKRQRRIYGWDLTKRELLPEPVLELSLDRLALEAVELGLELPHKKGSPRLKAHFSEVAVDPTSGALLLLCGREQLLLVVSRAGELLAARRFSDELLLQPEGLTFLGPDRLVISSEADMRTPALLRVWTAPTWARPRPPAEGDSSSRARPD